MIQTVDAAVAEQYQELPYPPRDPEDEKRRLLATAVGELGRVVTVFWGGRRRLDDLRLLDAGCGTGDSVIYMATQAPGARVVALDQSGASLDVARRRAAVRGLENIQFIQGSLLDLPRLGLGEFDYIVCTGVLHHLDDPAEGARALSHVLAADGGLGIMLYGQHGRAPVYQVQALMRRLGAGVPLHDRVALATDALQALGPRHYFKIAGLDRELSDIASWGASGIVDLLLHARDRAYTVDEVHALLDEMGFTLQSWVRPFLYRPETYGLSDALRSRVAGATEREREAIAELLNGRLSKHAFFARRTTFTPDVPAADDDPARVSPVFHEPVVRAHCAQLTIGPQPFHVESSEGFKMALELTPADCALLRLVDGRRSLADIAQQAAADLRKAGEPVSMVALGMAWRRLRDTLEPPAYLGYRWA